MTRAEKIELLRYIGGAGNVFLDTPEQRALIRKGMIRIVGTPAIFANAARPFAVITDAGTVAVMKIVVEAGERKIARGTSIPKVVFSEHIVPKGEKK